LDRRGFLTGILAACAAPAIVRADSLMRIVPRNTLVFHPDSFSLVIPGNSQWIFGGEWTPELDLFIRPAMKQITDKVDRDVMKLLEDA
jgi:hypothetical protein